MKRPLFVQGEGSALKVAALPLLPYDCEGMSPSELEGEAEVTDGLGSLSLNLSPERRDNLYERCLATALDLSQTVVQQPHAHFYVGKQATHLMAVCDPRVSIEVTKDLEPGIVELTLRLHPAYLSAATVRSRTDESIAAVSKMAQLMGRAETTAPVIEADLSKQLSMSSQHGFQPSGLLWRIAAFLVQLLRLTADVSLEKEIEVNARTPPEAVRPNSWLEWLEMARSERAGAICLPWHAV